MSNTLPLPAYFHGQNINYHPHVVILGAGASRAAFPKGDKNGKKPPVLNELVDTIDLSNELNALGVETPVSDFEASFDKISRSNSNHKAFKTLKNKIYSYFSSLELPETLTIYDRLILSLRPNDLIATFNWDPLLCLAFQRNRHIKELPRLAFLHGNVFVGYCNKCSTKGFINTICSKCRKRFKPIELLYPVLEKNYDKNKHIKDEWDVLRATLEFAFLITIYGYSAPKTDVAARQIMFDNWMSNRINRFGQIEIIDIKDKIEIEDNWNEFFIKNHYYIIKDFNESYLCDFPRRSCEAFASAYLYNDPWDRFPYYEGNSLKEYQDIILKLTESEILNKKNDQHPLSRW